MSRKLTVKQQEMSEKYATEIAKYVALVKQAEAVQAEMNESGKFDQYEIYVVYSGTMEQATEVLNNIEYGVMDDCSTIPYKEARNRTIDAFMAYVKSLAE